MSLKTEFGFTLPKGYIDASGTLHKQGIMRLATAADEILPMKDPRVQQNPSYLTVILLSRTIVSLGTLELINPMVIEELFSTDFSFLQSFYTKINDGEGRTVVCPHCGKSFTLEDEI